MVSHANGQRVGSFVLFLNPVTMIDESVAPTFPNDVMHVCRLGTSTTFGVDTVLKVDRIPTVLLDLYIQPTEMDVNLDMLHAARARCIASVVSTAENCALLLLD